MGIEMRILILFFMTDEISASCCAKKTHGKNVKLGLRLCLAIGGHTKNRKHIAASRRNSAGKKYLTKILFLVRPAESLYGKIRDLKTEVALTVAKTAVYLQVFDQKCLEYIL